MKIIETVGEMKAASASMRARGRSIALVPTMGCLHRGHRELMRVARQAADEVVLSIFVNPAQFGPNEDYSAYPRETAGDIETARAEGVDIVFAPTAEEVYPEGFSTFVEVEGPSRGLCGASRPGHFRGVATVVLKLFNVVRPDRAVFGRKDYQQLKVIERMVTDLDLDVEIIPVDTVRDPDGLATSSRNRYLSPAQRKAALVIPRSLEAAAALWSSGERDPAAIVEKMKKIIEVEPEAVVEYVEVRHPETLEPVKRPGPEGALVALAVRVGPARLIDNRLLL